MRSIYALWQGLRKLWLPEYRYPALDVALRQQHLHLVGSIHMGTRNMSPLPGQLLNRLRKADALVVEVDITQGGSPFANSEEYPPLEQRLSAEKFQHLQQLCDEMNFSLQRIDTLPAWQVALMLQAQQAQRLGLRADCGIDYQLLQAAKTQQLKIIELEGEQTQITLLKSLPEGGLTLLEDTLQHWHVNARLLQTMVSWWLETPPRHNEKTILPETFSNDLGERLMQQRNQRWCQQLSDLPAGNYVVAVGALHLYGEDNLPGMLQR